MVNPLLIISCAKVDIKKPSRAFYISDLKASVLRFWHKGILDSLFTAKNKGRRKILVFYPVGHCCKLTEYLVRKAISLWRIRVSRGSVNYLTGNNGSNSHKGVYDKLVAASLLGKFGIKSVKFLSRYVKRIGFVLRRRKLISHPRQKLPHTVKRKIGGSHSGYYLFVSIGKNKIAILSHKLTNKIPLTLKAHFVSCIKTEKRNSVKVRL